MSPGLIVVFVLTGVIHLVNTLAYAVRLSGVKTKRLAIALSLFNIIFITSQTANSIQGPLFNGYIETAIRNAKTPQALAQLPDIIIWDIRMVLIAATIGTIFGTLLIPSFVRIFTKGILLFEQVGSVPRLMLMLFSPKKVAKILADVKLPSTESVKEGLKKGIPKKILLLNIIITGVYTTGILSAIMAGVMLPDFRSTAVQLANVINGVATVLLATLVDPVTANIVDQSIRGVRSEEDVKSLTMYLAFSRIAGTVFAQIIFLPAAYVVIEITRMIIKLFGA